MKKLLALLFFGFATVIFPQEKLKLMTFNIYHGETPTGNINLDAFAEIINDEQPDIIALQEVDFYTNRSGKIDMSLKLAKKTKTVPLFARAMSYDGGEYGVAILSRFTFIKSVVYNLPYEEGYEPRVALAVDVKIGNDTLSFITTHLDYHENDTLRFKQAQHLLKITKTIDRPLFLLGDLNDTPESRTIKLLLTVFSSDDSSLLSFPCPKPEKKIDYILNRTNQWKLNDEYTIKTDKASDHCAVMGIFGKR